MRFVRETDRNDRDDGHCDEVGRDGPGLAAGPLQERGRDQWREAAGERRGELVAERRAAVARVRAEKLGEKRQIGRAHV